MSNQPINPKSPTDKMAGLPSKVTDLSYEEIAQAIEAYHHSHITHYLGEILERLKDGKTVFSKWDIEAMDLIIEQYNIQYKSPLALALSESTPKKEDK